MSKEWEEYGKWRHGKKRNILKMMDKMSNLQLMMEEIKNELQEEIEEAAIEIFDEAESERRMRNIGQNGNTGEHYSSTSLYPGDIKYTIDEPKKQ